MTGLSPEPPHYPVRPPAHACPRCTTANRPQAATVQLGTRRPRRRIEDLAQLTAARPSRAALPTTGKPPPLFCQCTRYHRRIITSPARKPLRPRSPTRDSTRDARFSSTLTDHLVLRRHGITGGYGRQRLLDDQPSYSGQAMNARVSGSSMDPAAGFEAWAAASSSRLIGAV